MNRKIVPTALVGLEPWTSDKLNDWYCAHECVDTAGLAYVLGMPDNDIQKTALNFQSEIPV